MLPPLPLEISSLILSHIINQSLASIDHPTFCFCAYHSAAPCSANIAASNLHALLLALPPNLKAELHRLCRLELAKRNRVEKLHEQFYWWTWGDFSLESEGEREGGRLLTKMRRMRPCCREGVTEEMVRMFAEVMVLRQFAFVAVGFVHEEVVTVHELAVDVGKGDSKALEVCLYNM